VIPPAEGSVGLGLLTTMSPMLADGGPKTFAALVALGVAGGVVALVIAVVGEFRARAGRSEDGRVPPRTALVASAVVLLGSAGVFFLAGLLSGTFCVERGCVASSKASSLPILGFTLSSFAAAVLLLAFLASSRSARAREEGALGRGRSGR
jgi:protein-S-isoprenylcysteine O-methyltransferase Ste14